MKRFIWIVLLIVFARLTFAEAKLGRVKVVRAVDCAGDSECLKLESEINKLSEEVSIRSEANEKNADDMRALQTRVRGLQAQIGQAERDLDELEDDLVIREAAAVVQYKVLAIKTREFYKNLRGKSVLSLLFSSLDAGQINRELNYRSQTQEQDRQIILQMSKEIIGIEVDKASLEDKKGYLSGLSLQLDKQAKFLEGEVAGVSKYIGSLEGKIAALSAKQQAIVSARSGSFITSVGSVPIGSDYNASIAGFEASAPGGYFAIFSFGAYTHRKGMSQYGAKARADEGQSFQNILKAYYGKDPVGKDTGGNISVSGYGDLNFEDYYLMGIAEMPSGWHAEALKAQAVAARTYAYRYKADGKTICTTESCQVFNKGKADNPPESWKNAVQQTRGQVLEDVVTFYSSTSGGYLTTMGWDTTDGSAGGDWTSKAWESKAGSPWFYKSWYRQSYNNSSSDCGRKPWMSEEEMADILNAGLVLKKGEGSGVDTGKILPVTIGSCPIGGQSGDPYSMSDLKSKLSNPVTSISGDPVVTNDGSGNTTQVKFQTNRGEVAFSGAEFKSVINTRAPGYIAIPQSSFAFFNIEKK